MEGATHFKNLLKQKEMAKEVADVSGGSISVEKAQKMIRKSIEAQEKANSGRAASFSGARSPRNASWGKNQYVGYRRANFAYNNSPQHRPPRSNTPPRRRRRTGPNRAATSPRRRNNGHARRNSGARNRP